MTCFEQGEIEEINMEIFCKIRDAVEMKGFKVTTKPIAALFDSIGKKLGAPGSMLWGWDVRYIGGNVDHPVIRLVSEKLGCTLPFWPALKKYIRAEVVFFEEEASLSDNTPTLAVRASLLLFDEKEEEALYPLVTSLLIEAWVEPESLIILHGRVE
jgi:hypothetical protein